MLREGVKEYVCEDVKAVELKEEIILILYRSAKNEPARNTRCLALFQIGLLVFTELRAERHSPRITEGIDILLASLHVNCTCISVYETRSKMVPHEPFRLTCTLILYLCYCCWVFLHLLQRGPSVAPLNRYPSV